MRNGNHERRRDRFTSTARSYRTYEEWKLHNEIYKERLKVTVLTVPMRNGNLVISKASKG